MIGELNDLKKKDYKQAWFINSNCALIFAFINAK